MGSGEHPPVAVVTGGSSGIGAATVARLASEGWHVAAFDRAQGDALPLWRVDVRDETAVSAAMREVVAEWGRVDAVVHAAAVVQHRETALELTADAFREIVDVNLVGSFVVARAAAQVMAEQGEGAIVLLSSGAGLRARQGTAAYGAAKAGVTHLTRILAQELAASGIRVNCVSPGVTLTPMMLDSWQADDPARAFERADAQGAVPLGRLLEPDEIAAAIGYLLSPAASAVTGHNLVVDGGRSL